MGNNGGAGRRGRREDLLCAKSDPEDRERESSSPEADSLELWRSTITATEKTDKQERSCARAQMASFLKRQANVWISSKFG